MEKQTEPASRTAVIKNVRGTNEYILEGLDTLIEEGHAREHEGADRDARPVVSVRAYREKRDSLLTTLPDPSDTLPAEGSIHPSGLPSPPKGDGGVGGVRERKANRNAGPEGSNDPQETLDGLASPPPRKSPRKIDPDDRDYLAAAGTNGDHPLDDDDPGPEPILDDPDLSETTT